MPTILDTILARKAEEVAERKSLMPLSALEQEPLFDRTPLRLDEHLRRSAFGLITEFKRRSPSKGLLNGQAEPGQTAAQYAAHGAAAISVLTDADFFGGHENDLKAVRAQVKIPVLRKDFVIDAYQLYEAKAIGADVILLIAAALSPAQCEALAREADALGLSVLLEVHDLDELRRYPNPYTRVIGVNNRNLHSFEVRVETSYDLLPHFPAGTAKISESGITSPDTLLGLRQAGYDGFLVGETFMRHPEPGEGLRQFVQTLQATQKADRPA